MSLAPRRPNFVNLSLRRDTSRGVPQSDVEAVRWYRLAAGQGDASAQRHLGWMYDKGRGVPQDYDEAAAWYQRAAEQGNTDALLALGVFYADGRGVAQDYVMAHMWANLAASRSVGEQRETAVELRDAVAEALTKEALVEAQRRAREWNAAHPQNK